MDGNQGQGCPARFTLYWLENKLLDEHSFAVEALAKLDEIEAQQPVKFRSTYTLASSASALINHWLTHRELYAYQHGKRIDDFTALTFEPINCTFGEAYELLQASIEIKRSDLLNVMLREGVTPPAFLLQVRTISQAPPPVHIIRSSAPDVTYKFTSPDWERWRRLDQVRLWQAACLAADIEPPSHPTMEIWQENSLKAFPDAFQVVWEVVNADAELSKLEILPESGRMLWKTYLPGFAKWAIDKGLSVPPEMREIAISYPTAIDPAPASKPARAKPQSGDSLTPVIWQVCYDLKESGTPVVPSQVMKALREMAERGDYPLVGVTAGGIKFEYEKGDEKELAPEALRGRIREWKEKTGG